MNKKSRRKARKDIVSLDVILFSLLFLEQLKPEQQQNKEWIKALRFYRELTNAGNEVLDVLDKHDI